MMNFDAYRFVGFMNAIHSLRWTAEQAKTEPILRDAEEGQKQSFIMNLREGAEQLAEMKLPASRAAVIDLLESVEAHGPFNALAINKVGLAVRVLRFEMEGRNFLQVQQSDLFDKGSLLFHPDMPAKFPATSYEIDEASKCLALERGTACVFHLMRTMEASVRATAKCLQIPDPIKPGDKAWGPIQKTIKDTVDARWPTTASRQSGDGAFFDGVLASLSAVRNPWRNPTMHIERTYTPEEARDILDAVRGFMRLIISRFDERGQPLA